MKVLSVQCLTDSSTLPLPTILPKLALLAGWLPMWVCDCTDVQSVQCTHRSGVDTSYRNWSGLQSGNDKTGCLHRVEWIWRGFPVAMLLRYLISLSCKVYHNKSVHIAMFVCASTYLYVFLIAKIRLATSPPLHLPSCMAAWMGMWLLAVQIQARIVLLSHFCR